MNKITTFFSVALFTSAAAHAVTFTYSELTSTTTQWSAGTSWDATPVSAVDTVLDFTGDILEGTTIVSNNDIAGNFLLNDINFTYAGTATGPSPTVTISGNPLEFSGAGAQIFYNAAGTSTGNRPQFIIDNDLVLSSDLTVFGNAAGPTPSVVLNGAISGSGSLTFSGTPGQNVSYMITNTGNSYTGDTRMTLSSTSGRTKILRLGASEVIPHGVGKGNLFFNSTSEAGNLILELNGNDETINGLSSGLGPRSGGNINSHHIVRNSSATGATLTLGDNDATATFVGQISNGTGGGALSLTKTGSGTQTLSGISNYTGDTNIQGGELVVNYNIYATGNTNDPVNYFSSSSNVILNENTTFAIVGRGDGATTSTENVTLPNGTQVFNLPNEVADQLVVGQSLTFTKTGGSGTPVASSWIVTMDRGATTTAVSGSVRLSSGGSIVTLDTAATIGSTSQTLAGLTLGGIAASTAYIDFGDTDNVSLTISSPPVQLFDGSTITLSNWSGSFAGGGDDQWLFVGAPTEFTDVFSQSEVIFDGYGTGYNVIDFGGTYEIVAVPEPTAYALVLALGALGVAIRRRQHG